MSKAKITIEIKGRETIIFEVNSVSINERRGIKEKMGRGGILEREPNGINLLSIISCDSVVTSNQASILLDTINLDT